MFYALVWKVLISHRTIHPLVTNIRTCRAELQVQGAKGRQLAASVTSWPENSNFVNSRCNSEFFFDAPLPAGTYDTKNG